MGKSDLRNIIVDALRHHGGRARLVDVAAYIWDKRETDLRASGDLFYTWQYDMSWAADRLRREGILEAANVNSGRYWVLRAV